MALGMGVIARWGALAHGLVDGRMQRGGALQPLRQACHLHWRKDLTFAQCPVAQCARARIEHVAAAALRLVALRHRDGFQTIQAAGLAQQRHHTDTQQRRLAAAAGTAHQHQPALAVQLRA